MSQTSFLDASVFQTGMNVSVPQNYLVIVSRQGFNRSLLSWKMYIVHSRLKSRGLSSAEKTENKLFYLLSFVLPLVLHITLVFD